MLRLTLLSLRLEVDEYLKVFHLAIFSSFTSSSYLGLTLIVETVKLVKTDKSVHLINGKIGVFQTAIGQC